MFMSAGHGVRPGSRKTSENMSAAAFSAESYCLWSAVEQHVLLRWACCLMRVSKTRGREGEGVSVHHKKNPKMYIPGFLRQNVSPPSEAGEEEGRR